MGQSISEDAKMFFVTVSHLPVLWDLAKSTDCSCPTMANKTVIYKTILIAWYLVIQIYKKSMS